MPASTPTLSDMVKEALDRGQTLDQLAKRAIDPETGKRASRGLIYDLQHDRVNRSPTIEHLRALAAAIGKPPEVVRQAAIARWLPPEAGAADDESLLREMQRLADAGERIRQQAALLIEKAQQGAGERSGERESA